MRIVSRPTSAASFRFTASSAISRTLHRALPSGGRLHTMAIIRWLWPAFSTRCLPGLGRRGPFLKSTPIGRLVVLSYRNPEVFVNQFG
jgi:hypothetical protein